MSKIRYVHGVKQCSFVSISSQRADIAVALLSLTKDRQAAVDFTVPIFPVYITVLYKKSIIKGNHTLEEFVMMPDMKYLAVRFTSNEKFFVDSKLRIVQWIYKKMQVCDTVNGS